MQEDSGKQVMTTWTYAESLVRTKADGSQELLKTNEVKDNVWPTLKEAVNAWLAGEDRDISYTEQDGVALIGYDTPGDGFTDKHIACFSKITTTISSEVEGVRIDEIQEAVKE